MHGIIEACRTAGGLGSSYACIGKTTSAEIRWEGSGGSYFGEQSTQTQLKLYQKAAVLVMSMA